MATKRQAQRYREAVERNLSNWKVADSVKCRLIRAGQYPLYRIVA